MSAVMRAKLVVGSVLKAEGENGYETVTFRAVGPSGGYPETAATRTTPLPGGRRKPS
jgi:hypothetical protein